MTRCFHWKHFRRIYRRTAWRLSLPGVNSPQTDGAALWADLSGFTPLTESLARNLLQETAVKIDDETLKTSLLQNVRSNREIVQSWEGLASP
jgi:hypothetical protein